MDRNIIIVYQDYWLKMLKDNLIKYWEKTGKKYIRGIEDDIAVGNPA